MSDLSLFSDNLDYEQTIFQTICFRKHLLKDQVYNLYVLPEQLIISKQKHEQKPKYLIKINLENSIEWLCEGTEGKRRIVAFGILYLGNIKYFYSSIESLLILKKILACKILYRKISDFYLALKCLGNGASSHVYLFQDINDQKKFYAAKCVEKMHGNNETHKFYMKKGLIYEINNMRKLDHPNILKLYEVYEGKQTYYLVMENLDGNSLDEYIKERQVLGFNNKEIKLIMKQILIGIAYMHQQNMIHRDIKPENIMFSKKNQFEELKIVDFGLATLCESNQFLSMKCGTPGYVAPEIANANSLTLKYDKVCDIFSAGVILYKLFTLKDLFPGTSFEKIFKLNQQCKYNLSLLQFYRVPEKGVDLIKKMLQQEPDIRINAQEALNHAFFNDKDESSLTLNQKKKNFQQMKKEIQIDKPVWSTQQFSPLIFFQQQQQDQFQFDNIEEGTTQVIPSIKSDNLGQFFNKKDLRFIQLNSQQKCENLAKRGFRKFNTEEFGNKQQAPSQSSFIMIPNNVQTSEKTLRYDLNQSIHKNCIPEDENDY